MKKNTYILTEGNIKNQLIKLAVPLLIGNIFQQFYNLVDTVIVGKYIGENAFAGLGVAGTVMNLFIFLIGGCCTGVSVILSMFYGKQDMKEYRKESFLAVTFGLLFTFFLSFISIISLPSILKLINTPAEIEIYVSQYLTIIFIGLFVTFLYNLFASQLRSMGNTRFALIFLVISIICNVILDFIFIKYLHFGISGAAWATVISQGISALLCFLYIKKYFSECIFTKLDMIFDSILLKKTLYFASISALHQSSLYIGKILVQGSVNTLGPFGIAAYTATNRIEGIANTFAISGTEAISVFIAQNIGAGNKKRAYEGFKTSLVLMYSLGIVMALFMYFGATPFIKSLLENANEETIKNGVSYLQIISYFYILCFNGSAFVGYFRGTGIMNIPFIGTTLQIIIRVILSYLFINSLELGGVALATGIGWIAISSFHIFFYFKTKNEKFV